VSHKGVGATRGVVTIVLLSMMFYFIEHVWIRLGTYDFLEPRNVVKGTTVIKFCLEPDG